MKTSEKLHWVAIIAAGIVLGNLLLVLIFSGFSFITQHQSNKICDEII